MDDDDNPDDLHREVEFGTLAEQRDEAFYDNREDADDDVEKGRIKFPKNKLYGRDKELKELLEMYSALNSENSSSRVVFLSGYSGTGKSALIDEFVKQISAKTGNKHKRNHFISGKFDQMSAGEPFKAISQALNQYVVKLSQGSFRGELRPLKTRLAKAEIYVDSDLYVSLKTSLMPDLKRIVLEKIKNDSKELEALDEEKESNEKQNHDATPALARSSSLGLDLNAIKYAFQVFLRAFATEDEPVTLFIDDLQWADDASLQLIAGLLADKTLKHLMMIGAYRTNEVGEEHELKKIMKDADDLKGPDLSRHIEISNLSPDSIAQFIADSIEKDVKEVGPIAEAVYSKTLGNIFFVQQAMEELVRKNAIYYDVVFFDWQFGDVTRVELEKFLSDDVVEMVLSKLKTLPEGLQKCLALAAYTRNIIELELLLALLKTELVDLEMQGLEKLMELAFVEGLVLEVSGGSAARHQYKFSHDRIQEAARASVPAGDERNKLLIRMSKVLVDRGSPDKDDWMLFTAAQHLNSVPPEFKDSIQVAELDLTVGKIASFKGAFSEACNFFRAGIECLDPTLCWKEYYTLCLELKSSLAQAEHSLAHEDKVLEICEEIFANAKSLPEKNRAYFCYMEAFEAKNSGNHSLNCDMTLDILALYGVNIPKTPTKMNVKMEKLGLRVALRGRPMSCVTKFPITTDPKLVAQLRVAGMALSYSIYGKRTMLTEMLGKRMLRVVLSNKVITKDVPLVFMRVGGVLRQEGKYKGAFAYANIAINLMERFSEEKGLEFIKSKYILYGSLGCLRLPFRDTVDTNLGLSKLLVAKGETLYCLGAGMTGMYGFLNASFKLNKIFESKLLLLEDLATDFGRKSFAVIYRLLRQCYYNLQGGNKASATPVTLKGGAYDEDQVQSEFEGDSRNMNNRDNGVIRLMLAVIFDDEAEMEQMLDRLDGYPIFDIVLERQHFRMMFVGLAAVILSRKYGKHKKWANEGFQQFRKLSSFGSPNAQPVYACLKALDKPAVAAFEDAIQMCVNEGLLHLAALMNEKCGLMLLEQGITDGEAGGQEYLKSAFWLYHDWGATAKVQQLQAQHEFLGVTLEDQVPQHLKSMRRHFAEVHLAPSTQDQLSEMRSAISG